MNFLITGAVGFLGSSLANHLAREGHQVRGIDDLSTGDPQALAPDMHFTRGDVSDRPKLWTLLQEVDVVYHLAARVSVSKLVLYPRDYNEVNVGGTVALMEAIRDVGVRRVVLASSGAVYGDLGEQPLSRIRHTESALAVCGFQARRGILCPHHWQIVGHRDGQPANLQRLWTGATSSGFASAGSAIFFEAGFARRNAGCSQRRQSNARLCLRGRCGQRDGGRLHRAQRGWAGHQRRLGN